MSKGSDGGGAAALAGLAVAVGGVALGAFLSQRHSKERGGDAPDYTHRQAKGDLELVGRTVTIRKPKKELYDFWRDFTNLPKVMDNLESIKVHDEDKTRSTWVIRAPAGQTVDVETKVTEDTEGEVIAWSSVEGSDITTNGRVEFTDAPGNRGTRVSLIMSYDPPAGAVGKVIAKLFMREPQVQARHDLKRLKMLMETGEIATSARTKEEASELVKEIA